MFGALGEFFNQAKQAVGMSIQNVVNSDQQQVGVPEDVAPEPVGNTTSGGKMCGGRRRKTRRSKKTKKTLRRKH